MQKGGMELVFDDDGKKIILKGSSSASAPTIEIDGNSNKIVIKVGDANSIELTSSGVKVKGTRIDLN